MSHGEHHAPESVDSAALRALLATHGLRATQQRVDVLAALIGGGTSGHPEHRSAAAIHDELATAGHAPDLATIYRTLSALTERGLLHATALPDGQTGYGLALTAHHHAVCDHCGRITEIPAALLAHTSEAIAHAVGFRADVTFTVHGQCLSCGETAWHHHAH